MQTHQTSPRVDLGHLILVLFFVSITALYLFDAWQASSRLRNLILILPASILSLTLCVIVLVGIVSAPARRRETAEADKSHQSDESERHTPETFAVRFKTAFTMGLFALYILSLPYLGFDVGTALFAAANLILDGERRPLVLIGIPVLFAIVATLCFQWLLPYPMPILIL